MDKTEIIEKFFKKYVDNNKRNPKCRICDQEIKEDSLWECEYIETKRKASFLAHRVCIQHGGYKK